MDFYKLSKTVLFQGATPEETEQMLSCLKAGKRKYKKEEMIYRVGEVKNGDYNARYSFY